ncbi:MAG: hypothetical protein WBE18_01235, partial [Gammaproteobacteria bacterium]
QTNSHEIRIGLLSNYQIDVGILNASREQLKVQNADNFVSLIWSGAGQETALKVLQSFKNLIMQFVSFLNPERDIQINEKTLEIKIRIRSPLIREQIDALSTAIINPKRITKTLIEDNQKATFWFKPNNQHNKSAGTSNSEPNALNENTNSISA